MRCSLAPTGALLTMTYVPPVLLFLMVVLAAAGVRRRNLRHGRLITGMALAALFLWSWEPVTWVLSGTLEWRYPISRYPAGDADAIVVLSGSVYPHDASEPEDLPALNTYVRSSYASWLYKNWRALPIVASGGTAWGGANPAVLSEVVRRILVEQGVPPSMIWTESRSRSTYENALYSAELLSGKGIHRVVLVTEAYHMLRSEKAFRHQGLTVVPAPCAYRYVQFDGHWRQFLPSLNALQTNELIFHEWLGVLWYWASGRI
ncbi:MAG: YdcF family protein [Acidobacteriia bacterium]|nr:YdcF family protein [Terriglobia bacterium]